MKQKEKEFKCLNCGKSYNYFYVYIIDIPQDIDLFNRYIDKKVNNFKCIECNHINRIPESIKVIDNTNNNLIYFSEGNQFPINFNLIISESHLNEMNPIYDLEELRNTVLNFDKEKEDKNNEEDELYIPIPDFDNKERSIELYQKGVKELKNNNSNSAILLFTSAIKIDPYYIDAFFKRGLAYVNIKDWPSALSDFSNSLAFGGIPHFILDKIGYCYFNLEKYDLSIEYFSQAIQYDSIDIERSYYFRGLSYYITNKEKEAINDFTETIEIDENYASAYYFRGLSYKDIEDNHNAKIDFQKAYDLGYEKAKEYL